MIKILWFGLGVATVLLVLYVSKIIFPERHNQLLRHDPSASENRINVPADSQGFFRPDLINITYPGGNRITAHKQLAGDRLSSIVLNYRLNGGSMTISCMNSPAGRYISLYVMTGQIDLSSNHATLKFLSGKNETKVLARLIASSEDSTNTTMRTLMIEGREMDAAMTLIVSVIFPAGIQIDVIDQRGQWHPLDSIPTTGVVQPVAWRASLDDRIPQPPSDPFQVMTDECKLIDK